MPGSFPFCTSISMNINENYVYSVTLKVSADLKTSKYGTGPSQQKPCAEQLHHLPEAHSFQIQFLNQAKLRLVAPDILEPYLMADPVLEVMKIRD